MKRLALACLIAFAACAPVSEPSLSGGFAPNEWRRVGSSLVTRHGADAATGLSYQYSSDRSAEVRLPGSGSWLAGCKVDNIRGQEGCYINLQSFLTMQVSRSGSPSGVCVWGHDFPGRRAMLRVDNNAPMTSDSDGCFGGSAAQRIGQQLASGRVLRVEAVEWPQDYAVQREIGIEGSFSLIQRVFRFAQTADAALFSQGG